MKLQTNGGIEPLKMLQNTLQYWFKLMTSCVKSFVIYETRANSKSTIDCHEQITTNLQFLRRFLTAYVHILVPVMSGLPPESGIMMTKKRCTRTPCGGIRNIRLSCSRNPCRCLTRLASYGSCICMKRSTLLH